MKVFVLPLKAFEFQQNNFALKGHYELWNGELVYLLVHFPYFLRSKYFETLGFMGLYQRPIKHTNGLFYYF